MNPDDQTNPVVPTPAQDQPAGGTVGPTDVAGQSPAPSIPAYQDPSALNQTPAVEPTPMSAPVEPKPEGAVSETPLVPGETPGVPPVQDVPGV